MPDHTFIPYSHVSPDSLLERESSPDESERQRLSALLRNYDNLIVDLQQQVQTSNLQLQQTLHDRGLLQRLSDRLRHCLDEPDILQTVIEELTSRLNLFNCEVALYEVREVLSGEQQPYQVSELSDRTVRLRCPIGERQEELGHLWLYRYPNQAFSEPEIDLVKQVAHHCAIALQQARLHQIAQKQRAELEQLNQIKEEFLNTVSYELRIPMANMKMAIQMLSLSLLNPVGVSSDSKTTLTNGQFKLPAALSAKIDRYLKILQTECDREAKLIEDLLDLQQVDTNRRSLVTSAIRLSEWLPYVVMPFKQRCQDYQLTLQVDIPTDLPPLVCDHISLARIITELLNNACKYTPLGGHITVTAHAILHHSGNEPTGVQIRVTNSGVEIPADQIDRIFDKFYRIPKLDIRKLGGTGLGLALAQKLVARLDGRLTVESANSQTCFTVDLPG